MGLAQRAPKKEPKNHKDGHNSVTVPPKKVILNDETLNRQGDYSYIDTALLLHVIVGYETTIL